MSYQDLVMDDIADGSKLWNVFRTSIVVILVLEVLCLAADIIYATTYGKFPYSLKCANDLENCFLLNETRYQKGYDQIYLCLVRPRFYRE